MEHIVERICNRWCTLQEGKNTPHYSCNLDRVSRRGHDERHCLQPASHCYEEDDSQLPAECLDQRCKLRTCNAGLALWRYSMQALVQQL